MDGKILLKPSMHIVVEMTLDVKIKGPADVARSFKVFCKHSSAFSPMHISNEHLFE